MSLTQCESEGSASPIDISCSEGESEKQEHTYGQILKSSALIGGSSALNIAIGLVRTKAMAMLLGPAGFGLAGLYSSTADLVQTFAGMGVNSSGVRQIAESASSQDATRMARTAAVLRRTSLVLGAAGAVLMAAFSKQISLAAFGSDKHFAAICLLAVTVLLRSVAAGQTALIQGLRRISDLAKVSLTGALFGTIISIPIVYVFREKGVAPSLVAVAAMTIGTSWWYSRKIEVQAVSITASQAFREASALLKLGFAFMGSCLMTMASGYLVRIIILRIVGFAATGLYQSAWSLGGLYVGFILQSMGADFYPRLTASVGDNAKCNRLVNEQARVGLLLAGPGALATLTFSPVVIALFYSAKFGAAVGVLRWICLGTALQVVTWPMGFIVLAKGRQSLFFWSDFAWSAVYVGLAWAGVRYFGLTGAGMAFFASYIFHALLTYPVACYLTGFRWSRENMRTGLLFGVLIAVVSLSLYLLPLAAAVCIGTVAVAISSLYSIRVLLQLLSINKLPLRVKRWMSRLSVLPSTAADVS
jgi:enterobacterial common antigen flippase